MSWADAMTQCYEMGAKLVEIESMRENRNLVKEICKNPVQSWTTKLYCHAKIRDPYSFWIGLEDLDEDDRWTWYAGRGRVGLPYEHRVNLTTGADGYQAWDSYAPLNNPRDKRRNCAHIRIGTYDGVGRWKNSDCSDNLSFGAICEFLQ